MSDFHKLHRKPNPSKYVKGNRIESLPAFIQRLEVRLPFIYRGRFMAAGFIEHWSFVQVRQAIRFSNLYCAVKRKKEDG